jgi:hypothetical protein
MKRIDVEMGAWESTIGQSEVDSVLSIEKYINPPVPGVYRTMSDWWKGRAARTLAILDW